MAYEIHWLRRASNELNAIYQFYCEFASEEVARRRIAKIIHSVDLLENMPFLGREDEDFTHIHFITIGQYCCPLRPVNKIV